MLLFVYSLIASKNNDVSGIIRGEPKPKPFMNPLANSDDDDLPAVNEIAGDSVTDGEMYFFIIIFTSFQLSFNIGSSLFALNDKERSNNASKPLETTFATATPTITPAIAGIVKLPSSIASIEYRLEFICVE